MILTVSELRILEKPQKRQKQKPSPDRYRGADGFIDWQKVTIAHGRGMKPTKLSRITGINLQTCKRAVLDGRYE